MIWLVGNRGMLGTDVEECLRKSGRAYVATDREVDITRKDAPADFLRSRGIHDLSWIINCAGYTAVEKAEEEPEKAFAVNEAGARNLAAAAAGAGARLLHISTDYVFDGNAEAPYSEEDRPHPLGVYAQSKYAGENAVVEACRQSIIIRTAWMYGRHGGNFVQTMLQLFRDRDIVSVVDDQWGSPTYARDLAEAILVIVSAPAAPAGIYNFTNDGKTNWCEFAREIYRKALDRGMARPGVQIAAISSRDYPAKVRRPPSSLLSKNKITRVFGITVRDWREALDGWFDEGDC